VRHARTDEQYERVLRTLLAKGVDVNLANKNGETPLHAACFRGNKVFLSASWKLLV
jgi:ankyrin repeat protein